MNIANMMFQNNVQPASPKSPKLKQSGTSSFESLLSKVGEGKAQTEPKSEAPKSSGQSENAGQKSPELKETVKESPGERGESSNSGSQDVKTEKTEKSLYEKLEELEAAIASGDSQKVESIFAELIAFLGLELSGEIQIADPMELKQQVEELMVKLEQLISSGEGKLTKLDLENISSGLEVVKELIAPLKEGHEHIFKELSAKLEDLSTKLEQKVGLEAPEVIAEETAETPQAPKTSEARDSKHEDKALKVPEEDGAEQHELVAKSEDAVKLETKSLDLDTSVKAVESAPKEILPKEIIPKDISTKLEFEKVVINQNMKLEMNHNMHTVINKEVTVEQNYLNMDKLDIIKQISARMKLNGGDTMNEIKMKLTPESLGELTIKVTLERGIISARAIVENPYVKQVMESNMAELKQNLKSQGINFDQIDVFVGEDPDERRQTGESYQDQNRKKKRALGGIEELDLEEAGRILGEDILSSERVDTII